MIIANLYGGLGNQLFQYAAAYSLSKKTNHLLKQTNFLNYFYNEVHTKFNLENEYNLPSNKISSNEIKNKIGLIHTNFYFLKFCQKFSINLPGIINEKNLILPKSNQNYLLNGYFQNTIFFKDHDKDIVNIFSKPKNFRYLDQDPFLQKINDFDSISIHIRGNDYLKSKNRNICNLDYYFKAIEIVKNKIKKPLFYIFTDDIKYASSILKNLNIKFIMTPKNYKNSDSLYIMSKCKHNIIANSSFSWWGAYLNANPNKLTISPKQWLFNSNININHKSWIQI